LELQEHAELLHQQSLEKKPQTKKADPRSAKLIPWLRGEENLQALWEVLTEHEYVENTGFQDFLNGHFQLVDKHSKNNRTTLAPKIRWYSSLENLLRMIECLVEFNITSVVPFGKKADTQTAGKTYNLIENHFTNSEGIDFKLDAIRKAAQRKRGKKKGPPRTFNLTVLRTIRSMQ
jgi:hypothetical protein